MGQHPCEDLKVVPPVVLENLTMHHMYAPSGGSLCRAQRGPTVQDVRHQLDKDQ